MMERFKIFFERPIKGQKTVLRAIAREWGFSIDEFGSNYIIIRNELAPTNKDEIFGCFDSEVSDIGLGVAINYVKQIKRLKET